MFQRLFSLFYCRMSRTMSTYSMRVIMNALNKKRTLRKLLAFISYVRDCKAYRAPRHICIYSRIGGFLSTKSLNDPLYKMLSSLYLKRKADGGILNGIARRSG